MSKLLALKTFCFIDLHFVPVDINNRTLTIPSVYIFAQWFTDDKILLQALTAVSLTMMVKSSWGHFTHFKKKPWTREDK